MKRIYQDWEINQAVAYLKQRAIDMANEINEQRRQSGSPIDPDLTSKTILYHASEMIVQLQDQIVVALSEDAKENKEVVMTLLKERKPRGPNKIKITNNTEE